MDTTEQTKQIVQQFMHSLSNRELNTIRELFAQVVDWYIPGNETLAPWLGKRSTNQEVGAFFQQLWQQTQPLSAQIDLILCQGNLAVVTGEFSTRMLQTGKVVNSPFSIQLTVENNLITKYRLLEDSYAVSISLTF